VHCADSLTEGWLGKVRVVPDFSFQNLAGAGLTSSNPSELGRIWEKSTEVLHFLIFSNLSQITTLS